MKLLLVHNHYRQSGGEDEVFLRESELLRRGGHEVQVYTRHNSEIVEDGILSKAKMAMRTLWAWDSVSCLRSLLRREKPDVAHFHNTFPLISPGAYYACQQEGIPVVQSLHNPRLICPAATLHREGTVCEECVRRIVPWPGVVHACYHNSHLQTAAVSGMLAGHRILGTWRNQVNAYIVFTEFYRQKFISAGLPREKIFVKPHFLGTDPGMKQNVGDYALFLGRLAPEKGVRTLLEAFGSGLPVIASRLGSMTEVLQEGQTGLYFAAGDPNDLASKAHWAWTHVRQMEAMGRAARAEYEAKYTAERNYQLLMEIYRRVRSATAREAA